MSEQQGPARKTFGTATLDAAVTREDFERALRSLHLSDLGLRDMVLQLAAQVVALTEVVEHVDRDRLAALIPEVLAQIRTNDARTIARVWIETADESKYDVEAASPPCDELLPICKARCCTLAFALSSADLDEGVIRWDYGQPYQIRQRASDGYCVHNDPDSRGCTVHAQRPAVCRRYDCRDDARIWADYERRILAPAGQVPDKTSSADAFDLVERARSRALAEVLEHNALTRVYPDDEPRVGPPASPRKPRPTR